MSDSPARPHDNCYWPAPGFLAGEYPGAPTRAAALPKLKAILGAGVTFFLDLTEPGELVPYEPLLAELTGSAGYRRMAIRDLHVPQSPQQMVAILDTLDAALAAGDTVYLHCWGGIGRTGTVAGCWQVRHGAAPRTALATLAAHLASMQKATRHRRSPETDEQVAYVMGWRAGR